MKTTINPTQENTINGVDVTRMAETIQNVRKQPELADFKFRARNRWIDGGYNQARVQDYFGTGQEMNTREEPFVFDADEPPVLLGEDRGANPVEILLAALSSCMTTSLAYHAAARGMTMENIQSEFEGDIDLRGFLDIEPEVRKGYQEIRVKFRVQGDADAEVVQELVRKSPVFDSLSKGVPIKVQVEKV